MKKTILHKMPLVIAAAATPITSFAAETEVPANVLEMLKDSEVSINTVWMLLAAMLVFFMQPGFALCEAGFSRTKNTANILFKNFVDFTLGSVCFWLVGFGVMWGAGGAGFMG
ncbi:MAG: ammonium transporter, partial [Prevotella sp.]|nr:ammonium transporter [Prevotella sp.]